MMKFQRIKRLLLLVLLLMLGGSLLGNLALGLFARRFYGEALVAQVWPAGTPPPILTGPEVPGARTVLLLGDSRIADWGLPPIGRGRVINAGRRGCTTAQLALSCPSLLDETRPQIGVIQIGINDLRLLGVRPDLRQTVVSGALSNIAQILQECRQRQVRVLLMPIWPANKVAGLRRLVWDDAVDEACAELSQKLGGLGATDGNLRVIDLFADLVREISPDARKSLYRDTLHFRTETYQRLTPLLEKSLAPWLSGSE